MYRTALVSLLLFVCMLFPSFVQAQTAPTLSPEAREALLVELLQELIVVLREMVVQLSSGAVVPPLQESVPEASGGRSSGGSGGSSANRAPTLELLGEDSIKITVGGSFTDPGATARDSEDGNITSRIHVSGTVNTNAAGTYRLTYSVTDSGGKEDEETRTVRVLSINAQNPDYDLDDEAELSVSSGGDPRFVSANITPLHVYVGQEQDFTVVLRGTTPLASVVAVSELDSQTVEIPLSYVSTANGNETWSGSWTVYDTHVRTYHTTFVARTQEGEENEMTLAWSDPCSGIVQGVNSTLSGNCTVSSVGGLDGGNLTIPGGTTLTLNSGTTWAWNPGTSITVNGQIAVNGTAELRKGYLFYSGSSNDSASIGTMVFNTDSTLASHVRAGTWFRLGSQTFAELSTQYTSATVTIGGVANGTNVSFTRSGTTGASYSKNGGGPVSIPGGGGTSTTINSGDTLAVTLSSQGAFEAQSSVTVSVTGAGSSTFLVTTKANPGGECGGIGQEPCP